MNARYQKLITFCTLTICIGTSCLAAKKDKAEEAPQTSYSTKEKIAIASAAAFALSTLTTFGFISYKYLQITYLLYAFRDENSNPDGWFFVPKSKRKICRKWEKRLPVIELKRIIAALGETYDLPVQFRSMIKEWKQGAMQRANSEGYSYKCMRFVQEAYHEEADLVQLKRLLEWGFANERFFNYLSSIMHTEGLIDQIDYYIQRVKLLRQIIQNSTNYDIEDRLYEERVQKQHELYALQQIPGAMPSIAVRNDPTEH